MNKELLEQIVNRDLEGYKVSDKSVHSEQNNEGFESMDSTKDNQSESSTPDFRLLRQKYLHQDDSFESNDAEAAVVYVADSADASDSEQDEIVAVEPETAAHPWDRAARPKAVVISGSEKKVIGEQG